MTSKSKIIAVANMKGGVGKTTVTTALAEGSSYLGRRTLVIDVDLQINASLVLCSALDGDGAPASDPWKNGNTIEDYLMSCRKSLPMTAMQLVHRVGEKLYLLSGSPSVVLFERALLIKERTLFSASNCMMAWLKALLSELGPHFDLIIFDTPPGLSVISECVVSLADLVVVPQAPDRLSAQGLGLYKKYLTEHLDQKRIGERTCVFINMLPTQTRAARARVIAIEADAGLPDFPYRIFQTKFAMSNAYREAMGRPRPDDLPKLWKGVDQDVLAATRELWRFVGQPLEAMENAT